MTMQKNQLTFQKISQQRNALSDISKKSVSMAALLTDNGENQPAPQPCYITMQKNQLAW